MYFGDNPKLDFLIISYGLCILYNIVRLIREDDFDDYNPGGRDNNNNPQ